MAANKSDEELIAAAVAGQRAAAGQLLIRYHDRLWQFIEGRLPSDLRSIVSADDVLQTTYVDVFRRIGEFQSRGPDSFCAWLTTIADHRLLDMIRDLRVGKRGGKAAAVDVHPAGDGSSVVDLLNVLAVDEHTPSRSVARHEAASAVHVALAGLKDDYREVLRMRYIEGRSVGEVAAKMNRSEGSVHMLCRRALQQLRAVLGRASNYLSWK
jgi:RNA polymerase sigma-70 factor (ECF subfamily)